MSVSNLFKITALSAMMLACNKTGDEPGPGGGKPDPVKIHTYNEIGLTINVLSADAINKSVTVTNIPDDNGYSRSITYKLNEDNSASNRVKLMFINSDISKTSSSLTGAYIGDFSDPNNLQVLVKSSASSITASSKDGKENAKMIKDVKTYGNMIFRNFADQEATIKFMQQLKDTTNISWVPTKTDFKHGGKDWIFN